MRKALNENPVVQMVMIGILVIVVGFLFMTRIAGGGGGAEEVTATDAAVTADPVAVVPPAPTAADPGAAAVPPAPATGAPAVPDVPAGAKAAFVAGPGLPVELVKAYYRGDTVVLLIVRENGIDDRKVRAAVEDAHREGGDVALFVVRARGIARYSRITQGVEVERVPALIVIRPKKFADGGLPAASISYGYRGPESIEQAVRDANYSGRTDVPYYPE